MPQSYEEKKPKILVACEFSGKVRAALYPKAWSERRAKLHIGGSDE